MKVTFEIEQEFDVPEGIVPLWAVWEKIDTDPDNDEIVETFPTEALAQAWIDAHTPITEEYLRKRGIIS